jgi:hypothetical protein
VLATCPVSHLEGSRGSEQASSQCACTDGEQDPAPDLSCVVGAGYVVEQEAGGDLVTLLPRLAQVGEDDVAPAAEQQDEPTATEAASAVWLTYMM